MTKEIFPIRSNIRHLNKHQSCIAQWISGYVITPLGIVGVFSGATHTSLTYVHKGSLHKRSYDERVLFTEKQLSALATRMVRQITANK